MIIIIHIIQRLVTVTPNLVLFIAMFLTLHKGLQFKVMQPDVSTVKIESATLAFHVLWVSQELACGFPEVFSAG